MENIKKEVENDCNGAEIQTKNEVSKPTVDAKGPISAGDKVVIEASKTYFFPLCPSIEIDRERVICIFNFSLLCFLFIIFLLNI